MLGFFLNRLIFYYLINVFKHAVLLKLYLVLLGITIQQLRVLGFLYWLKIVCHKLICLKWTWTCYTYRVSSIIPYCFKNHYEKVWSIFELYVMDWYKHKDTIKSGVNNYYIDDYRNCLKFFMINIRCDMACLLGVNTIFKKQHKIAERVRIFWGVCPNSHKWCLFI